jgi:hypothetical protein
VVLVTETPSCPATGMAEFSSAQMALHQIHISAYKPTTDLPALIHEPGRKLKEDAR